MDSPILLVTEDPTLAPVLANSLAPRGFAVTVATPAQSVAQAAASLPTLILLDLQVTSTLWQMLLGALVAEPRTRALPVVALTRTPQQDAVLPVIAGAHDVLGLPLDERAIDTLNDLVVSLSFQFGSGVSDPGAAAADRVVLFAERNRLDGTLVRSGAASGSATFSAGTLTDCRFAGHTGRAALAALLAASGDLKFGASSQAEALEVLDAAVLEAIDPSAFLGVEEAPEPAASSVKPLVLCVDDDADLVELIAAYLRREGFRVETASDGEEGHRTALEIRPDAIVSDLEMPVLDGWGFLRKTRADHRVADTPLVFLSAAQTFLMSVQAASAGAQDYLSKSGARELLPARLRAALAPRADLENAIRAARPARSRVELTGARWTLLRFAALAPRGSVIIADGFAVHEVAFEDGELRFAEVKTQATTLTGERALDAFIGARSGDLVIGHALRKAPNLGGRVDESVEAAAVRNNTAESLAVTRALGGREGLRVDPAVAAVYAKFGPVDGRVVAEALAAGKGPLELLVRGALQRKPQEIEAILRDLARRGVIRVTPY